MEEYEPEIEFVPELVAPTAPQPLPTKKVISIEPEFDSEIFDYTVIPEINSNFNEVRISSKHRIFKIDFQNLCEFFENSFYSKCSCAHPLVVEQKFEAQGFGQAGCEEITKEITISCLEICFQPEIMEESGIESSGDLELEIGSGEILDDDEGGDDDDWSSRAEIPSIEYEGKNHRSKFE
jgi:hypothetical protein